MKFSTALSFALVLLPALPRVSAGPYPQRADKDGKGANAKPPVANTSTSVALPSSTTTTPAAPGNTVPPKVAVNDNGGNNGGNQDPQKSLTLDPKVIGPGFAQNGQNPPVAGQVPSLTTTNNFINYCLTVPNFVITNGQQIQSGSCNPIPMGQIPSSDNMPSSKFVVPKNGDKIPANQQFTVQMAIRNMVTGNFVNAQANYFAAPQQLQNGVIMGHSHVVIEQLTSLDQVAPTNPKNFVFFKGLNAPAQGGTLSAVVTNGLPPGAYRICSINTSSNHQPVVVPIAQHGGLDDCSYFQAVAGGGADNGAPGVPSPTPSAPPAASPPASSPAAPGPTPPGPTPPDGGRNGGRDGRGGRGGRQ